MKLHLSALGWIAERPIGNRLRWHVPMGLHNGNVLRIPRFIEIQRAPLDRQEFAELKRATVPYPASWWTKRGDVPASIFSPLGVDFGAGVQAVSFTYQGPATTLLFHDGAGREVKRLQVAAGQGVYVEHADIRRLLVLAFAATLQDLRTLDLFVDRPLDWHPIAQIAVDPCFGEAFASVVDRYQASPTLTDSEWTDLTDLASEARSWDGTPMPDGEPSPYESLALMLSLRWEFAVLAGFGFCDGPYRVTAPLDRHRDVLAQPPNTPVAYRVLSRGEPALTSNVAVCLPWNAAPLSAPAAPTYGSATVGLRAPSTSTASVAAIRGFSRLTFGSPYTVDAVLNWSVSDSQSIGVQVEEEHGASVIVGSAKVLHTFTCRTRSKDDAPFTGALPRNFEVAFPDVAVRARASAIDGWDRVSPPSPFGPWCTPSLDHSPTGPQIEETSYRAGTVQLVFSDWSPDRIVRATAGRVQILRQTAQPRTLGVGLGTAVPLQVPNEDGWFEVPVTGATVPLAQFIRGTLNVGGISFPIHGATASSVRIRVVGGTGAWYDATQPAFLRQSASHPTLWTPVGTLPAASVGTGATFVDPLSLPPRAKALTYATRIVYWGGRSGPVGGMRQAFVQYPIVPMPPPFEVHFLGHDFFQRTLVRVRLTKPDPSGTFLVGAAQGVFMMSSTDDVERLTASVSFGLNGPRRARGGTDLLDVLNLPVPLNQPAPMTFVVQRVTDFGESAYSVAVVDVPALTAA